MAPTNRIKKYICWLWIEQAGRWRGVFSANDPASVIRCRDEIYADRLCLALEFPVRPATPADRQKKAD
jgi:hypothetical protein